MFESLKNQISLDNIKKLAVCLNLSLLEQQSFVASCQKKDWDSLSLKQRVERVASALQVVLSDDYPLALQQLLAVEAQFSGLFHWVFAEFVAQFGKGAWEISISALQQLTVNSTAEFAIRGFLLQDPERLKPTLIEWANSENEHVRRLASEGVRPRLPWAQHIDWIAQNPQWVEPIIEPLKADSSRYVQKSVANLLNDLSKTQPDWVLSLCQAWLNTSQSHLQSFGAQPSETHHSKGHEATYWIVKHALRTRLKLGDQQALRLLGYKTHLPITLSGVSCDADVRVGNKWSFQFTLQSPQPLGRLRVEYAVYFLRKTQSPYRKVFKVAENDYKESVKSFAKAHDFKEISTRNYCDGLHRIEWLVNGQVVGQTTFELHTN